MAGWSLRRRLVTTLVLLLVVAGVAITTVTTVAVRTVLLGQVDASLVETGRRATDVTGGGPFGRGGRDDGMRGADPREAALRCLGAPGQAAGTLCGVASGTATAIVVLDNRAALRQLTGDQQAAVLDVAADDRAHTVEIPGLGRYRVVISEGADGSAGIAGVPLAPLDTAVARTVVVAVVATVLSVVAAALIGGALIGRSLRPLQRVATTATRVSQRRLATGEVALPERVQADDTDERTEVGRVGAALNRLLGHVEAALGARQQSETQVRQFVADASHELRTPLAAIRGYAELARRSPEPVPPDVAHALSRVESESVRMTGLVADLLLLASLDSGRPLDRDPVDISAVVVDAVGDAHVAGPDHRWRLDVSPDPLVVVGDGARLHQVVANLLANARVHTPPGTTVSTRIGGDPVTRQVVIEVSDDGPGVTPALQNTLFQRFTRGDSSRSRAAGSTGLGLAIVAAVVEAHGGDIAVRSVVAPEKGHGATFVVRLPSRTE